MALSENSDGCRAIDWGFHLRVRYLIPITALLLSAPLLRAEKWDHLLDKDLSRFEVWMGIPHSTVKGLPEGTYQSDKVQTNRGKPLGLDADVKKVFSVIEEEGQPVLKITGEIYGGLTTHDEFSNYHLSTMMRWGDKKWEPRIDQKRDSGILYHCFGKHGAFWATWKASLEFQVQESDLGDFIPLAGPKVEIRGRAISKRGFRFDPEGDEVRIDGYIQAGSEPQRPHGEWNHLEIYVLEDRAVHVVNGVVVLVLDKATKPDGTPLTKGQLQIQSEAAEVYYKELKLRPITEFPEAIRTHFAAE